ncbi:MAG: response regulator [Gammaproteobacteria bacterium]
MSADDPKDLRAQCDELRGHLTRFTAVQQQLITTRDRLDRELHRFSAIHQYNTQAITSRGWHAFAELTAESVVDVFELEFGVLWLSPADVLPDTHPAVAVGIDASAFSPNQLHDWLEELSAKHGNLSLRRAGEDGDDISALGLEQLVIARCAGPDGTDLGLLLGGVTRAQSDFYDGITEEHLESFGVFSQQVGALLQSRLDQALIRNQLAQLRLSEERLALALEGGGVGLWDWNLEDDSVYFSPRWQTMLGFEPDELPRALSTWRDRVHPDDLEHSRELVRAHLAGETAQYIDEHRLRCKDGSYLWIQARAKALRDPNGKPTRMVGMHADISERKAAEELLRHAEEEQRRARQDAEAASRAKSEFLATMSHEIRTPMNGVLGMLQLLEVSDLNSEQREFTDLAHQSALSLLAILDDILDLSKVEAGKLELERVPYGPASVLNGTVRLFEEKAREKGLSLTLRTIGTLPDRVLGDPGRLRQILNNLLSNAIKFTAWGGIVIEAVFKQSGGETPILRIGVRDTGMGIEPEVQRRLFTPFTQADASTTRRFGGTGLGLAICRRLVELMGGDIRLSSEPGKGSEFQISIPSPIAPRANTANDTPAHDGADSADGHRVLLVEDNPVNRKVAQALLKRLNLNVVNAENGHEALECLRQSRFDLVLMDVQMPEMDGLEATRRLRARESELDLPHTPVVALTANAMATDRSDCRDVGMDDFIAKPIKRDILERVLSRWLPGTVNGNHGGD